MPRSIYDPYGTGQIPTQGGVVQNTNQRATTQAANLVGPGTQNPGVRNATQGGLLGVNAPTPTVKNGGAPPPSQYNFVTNPYTGAETGYDTSTNNTSAPIYSTPNPDGARTFLGYQPRTAPGLGDKINASVQQVQDYYNGLMRNGNSVNPADIERDMELARQNAIAAHNAEQQQIAQGKQQANQNAASNAAGAQSPGDINQANNPGTTMAQRGTMRGALRQPGAQPTVTGTTGGGTAPVTQTPGAAPVNTGSPTPGGTPTAGAQSSPAATPTAPGATGAASTGNTSLDAALQNISQTPDGALVMAAFNDNKKTLQNLQTENDQRTNIMLNGGVINGTPVRGINEAFNQIDANNKSQEQIYNQTATSLQGLIDSVRTQNETYLQQERKAQEDRLAWDTSKQERQLRQQETKNHQAAIVRIALEGGFGQEAGLAAVAESDAFFEQKIQDVQTEFGVQRTELSAKFTGLYLQNQTDYVNQSKANITDLRNGLLSIKEKQNSSTEARASAEQTLLKDAWTTETGLRKDLATANTTLADKMATMIADKRQQNATDANQAMTQLVNLKTQLGSNLPASVVSYYKDKLPGFDVEAFAGAQTLKEIEDAKKGVTDLITDPSKFSGDDAQKWMSIGNDVSSLVSSSVTGQEFFRKQVASKIANGDIEGAKKYIYTQAAESLTGIDKTNYEGRADQLLLVNGIRSAIDSTPGYKGFGFAESTKQKALSLIGQADPAFTAIAAPIGQLDANMAHLLSGAAVTPSEYRRLKTFLPTTGDGSENAKIKLDNMAKYLQWTNDARIARRLELDIPPDPTLSATDQKAQNSADKPQYQPSNSSIHNIVKPQANALPNDKIISTLKEAGFKGDGLKTAFAVVMAESGGNPLAVGDQRLANQKWGPSLGLFQMRSLNEPGDTWWRDPSKLSDPLYNAKSAYELSHGGKDWGLWATYLNGNYKRYLTDIS